MEKQGRIIYSIYDGTDVHSDPVFDQTIKNMKEIRELRKNIRFITYIIIVAILGYAFLLLAVCENLGLW